MIFHFIDVGQGNMVVVVFPDSTVLVYDCNITNENVSRIERYLARIMPKRSIDVFVNSHRDSDHMRGIEWLHSRFPIRSIWDNGVSSNLEAPEYRTYMRVKNRRDIETYEVNQGNTWRSKSVRVLNGKRADDDPNRQSIVLQLSNGNSSVLLAGDTDAAIWRKSITPKYGSSLKSDILYASHHGSLTFFDDPANDKYYYESHMRVISPRMVIISVGKNPHGHPDKVALQLYEKYASGSDKGNKIRRTDIDGSMRLILGANGSWNLRCNQ